jgi:hypothetical protein
MSLFKQGFGHLIVSKAATHKDPLQMEADSYKQINEIMTEES